MDIKLLEDGVEAFKNGNYLASIKLLKPFAENGNAEAQCILGTIYHMGLGVSPDGATALQWYQQSAQKGYAIASNNLAGIYFMGECGVTENYEEALKWCQLSQIQGFEDSKSLEIYIRSRLNSSHNLSGEE